MSPTFEDGDYVLTIKPRPIRSGLIYVVDHIDLGRIIKRVKAVDNGKAELIGDNPASTPPALLAQVDLSRLERRAWIAFTKNGVKRL